VYDKKDNELLSWSAPPKSDFISLRYFRKQIYSGGGYIGAVKIAIDTLKFSESEAEFSDYIQSFSVMLLLLLGLLAALAVNLLLISPMERITSSLNDSVIMLKTNNEDLTDFQQLSETVRMLKDNIEL